MLGRTGLLTLAMLVLSGLAGAQEQGFGLGIILGEPTGLTGKFWTGWNSAIDGAAAWSFRGTRALHLHADYLLHNPQQSGVRKGKRARYFGIGGRIKLEEESRAGVRIPLGILHFSKSPLEFFFEVVPMLDLVPETDFDLSVALGARFYFRTARHTTTYTSSPDGYRSWLAVRLPLEAHCE